MAAETGDLRVVFSGAAGRMGRALLPGLRAAEGIDVVGEIDVDDDLLVVVADTRADVVVDFTVPTAAVSNARAILRAGAQGVIGTTGFTPEDLNALEREALAAGQGLLVAPNFSVGMLLLQRFAAEAAGWFPRVEITESHHEGKLDSPSGTALHTARLLGAAGATPGPAPEGEGRGVNVDGVQVHSRRLPGIHARQEVHFGAPAEALTLSHDALSRDCYLAGVLAGIRSMPGRVGLLRGLETVLFASGGAPTAASAGDSDPTE
jgi:4-hydroxy-tetrahydrodipicolinate reductase